MLFGYLSMALLIGVFIRSQLRFFQKYLIPACIIAGFIMLILGPGLLNIVSLPPSGDIEFLVYNLLTAIFIIVGFRGFNPEKAKDKETIKTTAVITVGLSFQLVVGALLTLAVIFLFNPGLFSGFSAMLLLGQGFDPTVARFFGGFWEQDLGFSGGQSIAFAFSALGFLLSYVLGILYIIWAKKRGLISPIPGEEQMAVQIGIAAPDEEKKSAGLITTHSHAIETLSLHLAIIGLSMLIVYGLIRFIVLFMLYNLSAGMVIVAEILVNFNFLFGLLVGMAARRLMLKLKIYHVVDRGLLDRILGIAVDYMVVAAIASIPLVISLGNMWETLCFSVAGAVLILLMIKLIMERIYQEKNVAKQVALFGFLTGNISSSLVLYRVLEPGLEDPFVRNLAYAGSLSFVAAVPLFFVMNIAVIGGTVHILMSAGLAAVYGAVVVLTVYFAAVKVKKAIGKNDRSKQNSVSNAQH